MATQEIVFKISATDTGLKSAMSQARAEISATAKVQEAVAKGELSLKQQLAAAASLQRQRSAALISEWKKQEKAASDLARGVKPVSENLQKITDAIQTLRGSTAVLEGPLGGVAGRLGSISSLAGGAGTGIAGLAGPIGIAVAAIGGLVLAQASLIRQFLDLTKATAQWQGALFDTSQQLGVSTETLSAFEILAKTTGGSLEQITASLGIFQKNLESAQDPTSKEARLFHELGVEITDTEQTLRQTLLRLAEMPEGFHQTATALELFGRGGKSILAILKEMHGDLDGAIARFREMGLVVSQEDAKAADEFNDSLALLDFQIRSLTATIVKDAIPPLIDGIKEVSHFLKENQETIQDLGAVVAFFVATELQKLKRTFELLNITLAVTKGLLSGLPGLSTRGAGGAEVGVGLGINEPLAGGGVFGGGEAGIPATAAHQPLRERAGGGGGARRGESDALREAKKQIEAFQNLTRELNTALDALKGVDTATKEYAVSQGILTGKLKEEGLFVARKIDETNKLIKLTKEYTDFQKRQEEQVREVIHGEKGYIEQAVELIESLRSQGKWITLTEQHWLTMRAAILANHEALKMYQETLEKIGPLLAGVGEGTPLTDEAIGALAGAKANADLGPPPELSLWVPILADIKAQLLDVSTFIEDNLVSAFHSMVGAVGEGIRAWALYGESLGKAIRKALAASLAAIAADAAIQVIYHLAYALGKFAFGDAAGATKHLIAAAKFGAVAVAAGVGARLVAGSAANTAAGAAGTASSASQRATSPVNRAPDVRDVNRRSFATPQPIVHTLEFRVKGDVVVDHFIRDYDLNGRTRIKILSDGQG